jgi:secreted PhoX family phosphatase
MATRKLFKLGRLSHEGGYVSKDGRTIYLTDDFSPAVFLKFETTTPFDFTDGQLYAYKQSPDGASGEWVTLPMDLPSLINIRDVAIGLGATMFIRLEWVVEANGKIYISETGLDAFQWNASLMAGGASPARHLLERYYSGNSVDGADTMMNFSDFHGRVLEYDPATNVVRPWLNGGEGGHQPALHLSNPDGLAMGVFDGKQYLVINEDLNGRTFGRVNLEAQQAGRTVCEIYWVDASIPNPNQDDLVRFLVGPTGCETTGGAFTPDGSTYFVNIQHPSSKNAPPFNKAATIAITGLDDLLLSTYREDEHYGSTSTFQIHPNPASRLLSFNKQTDVAIYTAAGERVMVARNTTQVDISTLTPGVYFVQTIDNEVQKLVVK